MKTFPTPRWCRKGFREVPTLSTDVTFSLQTGSFIVGLPGLEPGTSSLSVPHPTFYSVLACPVIWLFCSSFTYVEHLLCPPRTSLYWPGCSTVAVNPFEQLRWLTYSSRVIIEALQGFARACQSPLSKGFFSLACRVLYRIAPAVVSEWCQHRLVSPFD
jgi:hypothetical protein